MSTYTPQVAINLVKNFVHGVPLDQVQTQVCDMVNSMIWTFYPWSWTISTLTAITLVDGTQDYTPTNTDILRPLKMRIARTDTSPVEKRELSLLANLGVELTRKGGLETNTSVGWFGSQNFFRLMYAASVGTGQTLQLQGEYQKTPTVINDSTMNAALAFPDYYFNVFVDGLKWQLYELDDDQRSGSASMTKNGSMNRGSSGLYARFMEQLLTMARTEDLASGDEFRFPESALGVGRSYWPGLYGI